MEKLIKSMYGQWSLVGEVVKTPNGKDMFALKKTDNVPIDKESNNINEKLTDSFKKLDEHTANNDQRAALTVKGDIKHLTMAAPKGTLDLGHLSKLYMDHRDKHAQDDYNQSIHSATRYGSSDLQEAMNHHAGETKSLKAFHKKHGDDGLKGLMHTMGSNGEPIEYSNNTMHPRVHSDLLDLIYPGKAGEDRKEHRHKGVLPNSPFHNTKIDPGHWDKVNDTYNGMLDDQDGEIEPALYTMDTGHKVRLVHAHDEAVINRGMDLFKKRYKLE